MEVALMKIIMMNDADVDVVQKPTPPLLGGRVGIRWMIRRDMPEVMAIEQSSFSQPCDEEVFLNWLRCRNTIGMVAEIGEQVVGFFIYELHPRHLTILDMATHPDFRHQGVGEQMMAKLQSKLSPDRRTKLVALLPESCAKAARLFFEKHEVEIRMTEKKGQVTFHPQFSAMSSKDILGVQRMDDAFMSHYGKELRDIDQMISNGTRYGIVAHDALNGDLLGFALYAREAGGLDLNGEYGIIVKPRCRRQGIGRKLMMELASQGLPITVSDIYLSCKLQVAFLKAMGVPVPDLQKFVTVKWEPK